MIRAIVVDDEKLARERLSTLLRESGFPISVIAEAASGAEAITLIQDLGPDVVFLDVQMPILDGFDVVELLGTPRPLIVFVTAYDRHAVKAFEVHALDYLTKPVRPTRLIETLRRLTTESAQGNRSNIESLVDERSSRPLVRLTVHTGRKLKVLRLEEIRLFEATEKVVEVQTAEGTYVAELTLDELERRLDPREFLRPHRSILVRIGAIDELVPWVCGILCSKTERRHAGPRCAQATGRHTARARRLENGRNSEEDQPHSRRPSGVPQRLASWPEALYSSTASFDEGGQPFAMHTKTTKPSKFP